MFILITGKPASGKSSILKLLKDEGYETFCVDEYVKQIYKVNNIGYIIIKQKLGSDFVNEECVDTRKLLDFCLASRDNYKRVNELIWPLIKDKLINLKKEKNFLVVEMSIYLLDRKYFSDIFEKIIIIDRQKHLLFSTDTQNKFMKYYDEHTYNDNDLIIENNSDLLICYNQVKNIVDKLFQRQNNSLFRPVDDGYYVNNKNTSSILMIWPSIYNFQFSKEIKLIENTFIDAINSVNRFVPVSLGVDMISYESVRNFLPSSIILFGIHLFPFSINRQLLVFLENKANNDTRVLVSRYNNDLYNQLFKKYYQNYTIPIKINNNDFLIINDTIFIIKSKYEILLEQYNYNEEQLNSLFKLFFSADEVIVLLDDEGSNDNNIYKYINYYSNVVFYSYDDKHRVDIFNTNKDIITKWAEENSLRAEQVRIIIFDDYCWLSYTNFVVINKNLFLISLCEINDILFLKQIKQLKIDANVVVIDGSLYQTNYYFTINSIILTIPELKF